MIEEIDLTMTAARRPELVAATLKSFDQKLFARLPVRKFYLNIDPIWGSDQDADGVEKIARSHFPTVIRRPERPSYGAAVKWLWQQPETAWFLHLEDDWLLSHPISLRRLRAQMAEADVAQIKIANWSRLGRRRRPPQLGLCPLFSNREFARIAATHMDPELDPDKQFRGEWNAALRAAVAGYRAIYFGGPFTKETAIDIGRSWRKERGIEKSVVEGAAVWSKTN